MLIADVIARLESEVASLALRVQGAAEFSDLIGRGALSQVTPCAFVIPVGLQPGAADAATGLFRQTYDEVVGVVIVVEAAGDATGGAALADIDALIWAVIPALGGWAPGDQVGVFRLSRGALVSLTGGTVIYQLDFAIQDQLRIVN